MIPSRSVDRRARSIAADSYFLRNDRVKTAGRWVAHTSSFAVCTQKKIVHWQVRLFLLSNLSVHQVLDLGGVGTHGEHDVWRALGNLKRHRGVRSKALESSLRTLESGIERHVLQLGKRSAGKGAVVHRAAGDTMAEGERPLTKAGGLPTHVSCSIGGSATAPTVVLVALR